MLTESNDRAGAGRNPRYYKAPAALRDRWMVSYMDVLTIVLMFFLGIAAQSLHHPQQSANAAPPAPVKAQPVTPPVSENRLALERAQKSLDKEGIDLRMEPEGLLISLPQAVLFASGEDRVSREALPMLAHIADALREIPNDVRLVGHADSVPVHNRRFRSNWELAMARSLRIQELLTESYGIPEARLSIASYGPMRPNSTNDTPDGRARNRRVEILVLEKAEAGRSADSVLH